MTQLINSRCKPLEGQPAMNETEIRSHLNETFMFKDYLETLAFINAMGWICHTEDHHPDVSMGYNRVVVRFNTHSVGGVSINDFICAAKVNALVAFAA
jgi:4a-hydroxytetrahydrobiopterin dehydratase